MRREVRLALCLEERQRRRGQAQEQVGLQHNPSASVKNPKAINKVHALCPSLFLPLQPRFYDTQALQ